MIYSENIIIINDDFIEFRGFDLLPNKGKCNISLYHGGTKDQCVIFPQEHLSEHYINVIVENKKILFSNNPKHYIAIKSALNLIKEQQIYHFIKIENRYYLDLIQNNFL